MATISNLSKRYQKQRKFERKIKLSLYFIMLVLVVMMGTIFINGLSGFSSYYLKIDLPDQELKNLTEEQLLTYNFTPEELPIIQRILGHNQLKRLLKGNLGIKTKYELKLTDNMPSLTREHVEIKKLYKSFKSQKRIIRKINFDIIINNDSRYPENTGLLGSITGSLLTVMVALLISLPIGVITGIYLEEIAKNNWLKNLIEANINNLAAIPSIIYGLLGLSIFIAIFHIPRSSALLAGLSMSIMTLPLIIISTRQSLKAIPQSLRQGVTALGISQSQLIIDHLLPLTIPGIMSGTIFTVSRILGETAPLLMLGLVAFIANTATNILEPTTTLTVQIYLWSIGIEKAYITKTFTAIMVLLIVISLLNLSAFIIRKKYEYRW
ncbi:PstA family ABC transporter permease [Rickettsiales endosymbiont of Stachyamoeba lipophora]|uniref:PstA family ABC transporter permease n=1 Tax=Rickettsiales endosymbiont of Stachyamoeba lipophora TaxID=2486578 RepID=UPI000F64FEB9|nr:PstA family ABC transporter permease [Rickettsiales endosymbiont of Stachyamoeba lipophora]AZL15115.1 phosphate ABC transporter, permease protein PstA [Rickettsiales endosymbiont of Stachyamoeba lipophora]